MTPLDCVSALGLDRMLAVEAAARPLVLPDGVDLTSSEPMEWRMVGRDPDSPSVERKVRKIIR
jgi:hypothetical protein